ncbi:MAG TPA: hypothetical protein VM734_33045 [Kofleriaceae bacterium]|nr:hypothetical protein [Kofleriaceae bacterium]
MGNFARLWLATLLLGVGCGGGGGDDGDPVGDPDAGGTTPDAADPDARVTVQVHVLDPAGFGTAAIGVPVVFIDPDGTLVLRTTSDTSGNAQADVRPGASVTVVHAGSGHFQMRTVLGLDAARTIVIGSTLNYPVTQTVTVGFPAHAGASSYVVHHPCGQTYSTGGGVQIQGTDRCKLSMADLVVEARDAGNSAIGFLVAPRVSLNDGASVNLAGTYQFAIEVNGAFTNVPADVTSISFRRCTPEASGACVNASGTPAAGGAGVQVRGASTPTVDLITTAFRNGGGAQHIAQRINGATLAYGLDVGGSVGPFLGDPTLNLTTGRVSMPPAGGAEIDGAHVQIAYHRPSSTTDIAWLIDLPAVADFDLPELPIEVGDVMPKPGDTSYINGVWTIHAAGSNGYAGYLDRMPSPLDMIGPLRAGATKVTWNVSAAAPTW